MPSYAKLLGPPGIRWEGTWFEPPAGKMAAFMYYLAAEGAWVTRDTLVYLFWPDTLEHKARRNLSRLLNTIKALPYTAELEVEVGRLRWGLASDSHALKQALTEERWSQAVKLYQGKFLEDFKVNTIPEFDNWLELERENLHQGWRQAVFSMATELQATQRSSQATELLARLYRSDPLDEEALQYYLHSLQQNNQPIRALEAYTAFCKLLQRELGGEPDHSTVQLAARIRNDNSSNAQTSVLPATRAPPPARYNLPVQATPFVGREQELAWLVKTLEDPECRLLTLVGPGGIGKTRLALAAAQQPLNTFPDGICFVSLAPLTAELMIYAVTEALNFTLYGDQNPQEQLIDHLRHKSLLLILDNLEHLLVDTRLISDLLTHTHWLKILATSRVRLNLHAEWIIDVPGLDSPAAGTTDIAGFDAIRLFLQSAGRVRSGFACDDSNRAALIRICDLVGGMPLALELAASWLRVLTPEDIITELERGIDFLQTTMHDLPTRHQSMRAVFDHSWALLSQQEQEILRKLAVVRGGFTKEAAAEVVGASLSALASLVEKSLLKITPGGRYVRHPLVFQYTQEKLLEHPQELEHSQAAHGAYYLRLLEHYEQELWVKGNEEEENIRTAWQWAITGANHKALRQAGEPLRRYFDHRARFHEGAELFSQAAAAFCNAEPAHSVTRGLMLIEQAWFSQRLGRYLEADQLTERGLALAQSPEEHLSVATGLQIRGNIARRTGDYPEAKRFYRDIVELARANHDPALLADGLVESGNLEGYLGNYAEAAQHFQEATTLYEQQGNRYGTIKAKMVNQGWLYLISGRVQEAKALLEEGLRQARDANYDGFVPHILNHLAKIAYQRDAFIHAQVYGQDALREARANGNQTIETAALNMLGRVQAALGDDSGAQQYLKESLALSWPNHELPRVLESLTYLAEVRILQGRPDEAAPLLTLVLQHPVSEHWIKRLAQQLQADLPDQPAAPTQDLEATVTALLKEM